MPRVLTIDFECWPQMVYGELTGRDRAVGLPGLQRATDALLTLCARFDVKATVFVLGATAAAFPHVVRQLAAAGHELGAHGERHERLDRMATRPRRQQLSDVKARLEDLSGRAVVGFRAPYFSVSRHNLEVLDELADAGYRYDSSIYPIVHRRYGMASWPRGPELVAGGRLVELPLATAQVGLFTLPIAGGGYWRALPQRVVLAALSQLDAQALPVVVYLHPYQLDPQPPQAVPGPLSLGQRLRAGAFRLSQRVGRGDNAALLEQALGAGQWVTAASLADAFLTRGPASPTPLAC